MNKYRTLLVITGVLVSTGLLVGGISLARTGTPAKTNVKLAELAEVHTAHLGRALKAMDAAEKAFETGDNKTAKAELELAKSLITTTHKALMEHKLPARVVNIRCPMMGTPIDPEKVPANLTRTFRGQRVAFCCAGCPMAWDRLTDTEKQTKLSAVLPE
jgi:hypothetical protein